MRRLFTWTAFALVFFLGAPAAVPQPLRSPKPVPQKAASQKDVPAEMQSAIDKLKGAKNDLDHAGDEWGGHRSKAIEHINLALEELKKAMDESKKK